MSTRSIVAMKSKNGYTGVYVHFDGYISGVGKTLLNHYSDETKLQKLIEQGAISSLGKRIGTKHSFDDRPKNETTFYHRDRGEPLKTLRFSTVKEMFYECDYFYIWENGEWEVSAYGKQFEKLAELV